MEVWMNGAKNMLFLRAFAAEEYPDDGTLMPKYVGICTWYEVFIVIYFIIF